jgi:hypothetical protein
MTEHDRTDEAAVWSIPDAPTICAEAVQLLDTPVDHCTACHDDWKDYGLDFHWVDLTMMDDRPWTKNLSGQIITHKHRSAWVCCTVRSALIRQGKTVRVEL